MQFIIIFPREGRQKIKNKMHLVNMRKEVFCSDGSEYYQGPDISIEASGFGWFISWVGRDVRGSWIAVFYFLVVPRNETRLLHSNCNSLVVPVLCPDGVL